MISVDTFVKPYIHGAWCNEDGEDYALFEKLKLQTNKPKYFVPINHSNKTKIEWLSGLIDYGGFTNSFTTKEFYVRLEYNNRYFVQQIDKLLNTLHLFHRIEERIRKGLRDSGEEIRYLSYHITLQHTELLHLKELGLRSIYFGDVTQLTLGW